MFLLFKLILFKKKYLRNLRNSILYLDYLLCTCIYTMLYIFRSLLYDVRFIVMCVRAYERAGSGDMALYKCL